MGKAQGIFQALDKDNSGELSREEILIGLRELGHHMTGRQTDPAPLPPDTHPLPSVPLLPADRYMPGSCVRSLSSLHPCCPPSAAPDEEASYLFHRLDLNGDGLLQWREFASAFLDWDKARRRCVTAAAHESPPPPPAAAHESTPPCS